MFQSFCSLTTIKVLVAKKSSRSVIKEAVTGDSIVHASIDEEYIAGIGGDSKFPDLPFS